MNVRAKPTSRTESLVARWEVGTGAPPKLHLSLPAKPVPPAPRASAWELAWWLLVHSAVWTALALVIPEFDRMYRELGVSLPSVTEALVAASRFAASPLGLATGVVVAVAAIVMFFRYRTSPSMLLTFRVLGCLGLAFGPFAVYALFVPLTLMGHKL